MDTGEKPGSTTLQCDELGQFSTNMTDSKLKTDVPLIVQSWRQWLTISANHLHSDHAFLMEHLQAFRWFFTILNQVVQRQIALTYTVNHGLSYVLPLSHVQY